MRVVEVDPQTDPRWEAFVAAHPDGLVYHHPAWLQALQPTWVDTTQFKKAPPWKVCFSNADFTNPWRLTGYADARAEVKLHPEIGTFTVLQADGKDSKQISDLAGLDSGKCDVIIISPNTTGRRSAWRRRPACSWRRSRNAPSVCASDR